MASLTATAAPEVLAKPAARVLSEALGERVLALDDFRGDLAITVDRQGWVEAARLLRDHPELDYKLFLDLCGVDYLDREDREERYEVVLHLYSVSKKHHVRLKTPVPEAEPKLPTLTGVFKGANWFEREAWDLYGIVFEGHPNLVPHPDPRVLRGAPDAEGLPHRAAPRPQVPEGAAADGPAGLGEPGHQHRPLPPVHARGLPRAGAARRGDDRRRRGRDRLHAPQLREDGGGADLLADHPLHRPPELLLVLHERPRLGARGGEAAGRARPAPRRGRSA